MNPRFRWHPEARLFGPDGAGQPPLRAASPIIADRPGASAIAVALGACDSGRAFRIGAPDSAPPAPASMPVFETLTAGSSGSPRRIRRTQASWTASFVVNADLFQIGPSTRVAVAGRLGHSLALYGALEAMHLGATLHLLDGLRPDHQVSALVARQVEILYATPAQLGLMCGTGAPPAPGLRLILCGGARLDPATREVMRRLFPHATVREFYGAAEASFITLSDATTPATSVGPPYPGVEIDLRGPPSARQVWVRSPYLFLGYAGAAGPARWHDGWLSVGEIARRDGACLILLGRADRMVTVADQNVFPEQIEAFLLGLAGVTRAAVLARPDPRRGHVIEAVVEGGDTATILAACRAALGPLAAPRRLHRLAHWPLLPSGKTDLRALQRAVS